MEVPVWLAAGRSEMVMKAGWATVGNGKSPEMPWHVPLQKSLAPRSPAEGTFNHRAMGFWRECSPAGAFLV
jgi:hypothetical protein